MNAFQELATVLIEKQLHISAAESCTGGLFISSLIDHPGTSSVVDTSLITYSAASKIRFVGVDKGVIEKYGLVSENTAAQMAQGVSELTGADIGIGITGNAGPAVCDEDQSVGTVCFGFYYKGNTYTATEKFNGMDRNEVRKAACEFAAERITALIRQGGDK